MSNPLELSEMMLQRRRLLTRGVAAAGVAAGAVALSAAGARPAAATDGDTLTQGGTFSGGTTTTLEGGSSSTAPLKLTNASGPALELTPVGADFLGDLAPGQLLATDDAILVGRSDANDGTYTTALATVDDANLTFAISSYRLLDTRSATSRGELVAVGGAGFDSSGRLRAGSYVDIFVAPANADFSLDGVFLNLTSTGSTGNGFLFAYPSGTRPVGSTTSYQKGITTASSCLSALGTVADVYTVRIYTSTTSHVVVDLTGASISAYAGPAASAPARRSSARRSAARRMTGKLTRR